MAKPFNPRRYDRIDAALSMGLFLVILFLFCLVIENEGRKMGPVPSDVSTPLDLGMN